MEKQIIRSLHDLLDAVNVAQQSVGEARHWWRGQGKGDWKLRPGICQDRALDEERDVRKTVELEKFTYRAFRTLAPARYAGCPNPQDFSAWLFLMQHHRLRTRLMDWTESPLIALHFAVRERIEGDAALWVLNPGGLNSAEFAMPHLFLEAAPQIKPMFDYAFAENVKDLDKIAAVIPTHSNPRMMNQLSRFTIHGSGSSWKALESIPNAHKFLQRFEIPHSAKSSLGNDLRQAGISESILFPDLDHLANEINAVKLP